jgi:hypothetical protein
MPPHVGRTFREDRDIWTTGGSRRISGAASFVGEVESPFRKLATAPLAVLAVLYDDLTRPIPLIISRPQTPRSASEISWGHMASESRSPVIPANLTGTWPGLHPFTEKGTRNRQTRIGLRRIRYACGSR